MTATCRNWQTDEKEKGMYSLLVFSPPPYFYVFELPENVGIVFIFISFSVVRLLTFILSMR